jgi:hypothetical protein
LLEANFPGVVEDSSEFDKANVTRDTQSLELSQKLIGSLANELSMMNETVGSAECPKQFVSAAAVFEHSFP